MVSYFNVSEHISYNLINNEKTSSGNWLTLIKTTLLPGQKRVTVVFSLPTSPSRDVTENIPIEKLAFIMFEIYSIWFVTLQSFEFWVFTCRDVCKQANIDGRKIVAQSGLEQPNTGLESKRFPY